MLANDFPSQAPGRAALPTRATRKNLMLAAEITAGALKAPVRIRNLSETGAMLDGAALPEAGTALTLRRMAVEIGAEVTWRTNGRCGIRFEGAVSVDEWVAGGRQPAAGFGQARVDAIQTAIRSGAKLPPNAGPDRDPPLDPEGLDARIAAELAYVRRLLDAVGDALTDDPLVLQRHGTSLQNLDAAGQILDHLGTVVPAADRAAAVRAVPMHDLRSRLLRTPLL